MLSTNIYIVINCIMRKIKELAHLSLLRQLSMGFFLFILVFFSAKQTRVFCKHFLHHLPFLKKSSLPILQVTEPEAESLHICLAFRQWKQEPGCFL